MTYNHSQLVLCGL